MITYACSGNMAEIIKKNHNGIIVDNKDKLISLLKDNNSLSRYMTDFFMKSPHFPLEFKANDEIVRVTLRSGIQKDTGETHEARIKRKLLAEVLYRFQNRSTLNKLRNSLYENDLSGRTLNEN